jgi:hypothetical protein
MGDEDENQSLCMQKTRKKRAHNLLEEDEEGEALLVGHGGEGVVGIDSLDVRHQRRERGVVFEGLHALFEMDPADAVCVVCLCVDVCD